MANPKVGSFDHGTMTRYSAGCRCNECKRINTQRCREYRAKMRGEYEARPKPEKEPGKVEAAVRAQLENLVGAQEQPGLTEVAYELARLMDDESAKSHKPAAAGKLQAIINELRKGGAVGVSRLDRVKRMTA